MAPIDTSGDPDELLGNAAIGRLLGIRPDSWRSLVKTGHAPAPDYVEPTSGIRRWRRGTIIDWYPTRPGRGFHATGAERAAISSRWPARA